MLVEERISAKIQKFDIGALLELLYDLGYTTQDVLFEANTELASSNGFCESIAFQEDFPKVRIVLNMGLLSANSPLPSLFRKKMDDGEIDGELFSRFLSFFDHQLILQYLEGKLLDQGGAYFEWEETKKHYLHLLVLNSISTISFLLQQSFPELVVKVEKNPMIVKVEGSSLRLGRSCLGRDTRLGESLNKVVPSFRAYLISDESHTDRNIPWPQEARDRLFGSFFSYFQSTDIHLSIKMILENCENPVKLAQEPIIGYGTLGRKAGALVIHLYNGYPRELVQ